MSEALMGEAENLDMQEILHEQDRSRDTVLRSASSNGQVEIVPVSSTTGPMVLGNSLNNSLPREVVSSVENSGDSANGGTTHNLDEGVSAGNARPSGDSGMQDHQESNLQLAGLLIAVLGIFVAAFFAVPVSLLSSGKENAEAADIPTFKARAVVSGSLPSLFYEMVFNNSFMVVAMCSIVLICWQLPMRLQLLGWSLSFRPVVLFLAVNLGIVYVLIVNKVLPRFWVGIGHHDKLFSSTLLVWLLTIAFILCGAG